MEVNKNIVSNCKFYCVTGEGGRCGNGHFCGDVIFEWPHDDLKIIYQNLIIFDKVMAV